MSVFISVLPFLLISSVAQDLPPLPTGLSATQSAIDEKKEPAARPSLPSLPQGLGGGTAIADDKPSLSLPNLPSGLESGSTPTSATARDNWFTDNFSGFVEARTGIRLQDDPTQKGSSISEIRAQFEGDWPVGPAVFNMATDIMFDPIADDYGIGLNEGRGVIDLRKANIVLRPLDNVDLKIGRQINTWGTGDLLFINDLFPKDYNSFFIGRDDEYLKAPSDAIRGSVFSKLVNVDVVYTPQFDADRYIDGGRLSYFDPMSSSIVGRDELIEPLRPDQWFEDDEIAVRASRNVGAIEIAAYAYDGFWKSPAGVNPQGEFIFPKLAVYGASARGPIAGGIGHIEFGLYDSQDDTKGNNPLLPNSQTRYLVGFEREAMQNLTIGVQYYAEHTEDFSALQNALPLGATVPDETRHVITTRVTKLAYNQNLTLSVFNTWSPNQEDDYLRARASYKVTDDWLIDGGVNVFYGEPTSFFGQFEDNTNAYVGLRRSF